MRRGDFGTSKFGLLFGRFSLGPPFAKFQKMADLGVLAKSALAQLRVHLWSRALPQNVFQRLHFKPILIGRLRHLRRGDFGAPKVGLLFGRFSLGPPFSKFQKMADLGVLAKSALAQLRVHLSSRALPQNVFQGLHFKPILIGRLRHLRRGDFGAPKVGLLFGRFSLGPPFAKFQKMADLGVLAKSALAQLRVHLWSRALPQNALQGLHFKRILYDR